MTVRTVALKDLGEDVQKLLVELPEGEVLTVTDGRRSIARIERGGGLDLKPVEMSGEERLRRHREFVDQLARQPALNLGKFYRDELYEDGE